MNRKNLIIIGIGILIIIVFTWTVSHHKKVEQQKNKDSDYVLLNQADVFLVKRGEVDNVVPFTGDLAPLNQTVISSEIDAQVLNVRVNEGQFVKKSQVLAVLDSTDLKEAVSQQQALLATSKVRFALDKTRLERQKELYNEGFISKLAYDELQTNYQAGLEAINQQQAALQRAKKQLSDTVIKAPFSGYIYQKFIDSGQLANKNSKLFALANLDTMQIKAAIPGNQVNSVKPGQLVEFKVESAKGSYQGKIALVNPVAQAGTRSYMIYINFDNHIYQLKAGQFVKGYIILEQRLNTPYIPKDAVRQSAQGNYVLVLQGNKIVYKPIQISLTNSLTNTVAVSGLVAGDQVLSGNILTVKPGGLAKIVD